MKFSKLDLLTLLISLFLFASCENTSTIGLEVDPSSAIQGSLVDSITITSRTIKEDEISTVSAVRHPLGYMKDPLFGTTESSLAMAVNLPNDAYDFGTTPVIDSAILVLNYGSEFYGDSTLTYSIDVHPLNINISKESSFLSNRNWTYNNQLIGNKTGKLYPTTKYKVNDIVVGKADTLKTVTPQIRIPLDKTFIQNNIANLSSASLKTNSDFNGAFNGLHVQINKTNSTGNGGIAFFDFAGTTSALVLYYKKQNATTTTLKDTVSINFPIVNPVVAATIKHDYSGTPVANQLAAPTVQQPVTYLQPLVGLRNKITFPYLSKFAANIGKIVINKAELVIDVSTGTDVLPYGAAPRLSLYRYDIAEQRQNVPDNNAATQYTSGDPRSLDPRIFGGYYNSVTKQYVFVVTSYIQDLLDGKTTDYGTFLATTPTNEYQIYPSISTAARSVIGSFKKSPVAGDNLMKLNIYYTKIN
ncbi:DUF4270 domain-containing protein [Pedobacter boryungensis]|uniref:DUF4270 domain-containing protein n=1 Tax=Pedobacter boryungensis TaxID=869962 RepID=A0ABX2DF00_9SPHI|nr:DUF4270 domain-containing protein [Pedobacter boryungensis]NQX31714.1 DUF4270 domain-containing protein [Pedobacter boryungensis]